MSNSELEGPRTFLSYPPERIFEEIPVMLFSAKPDNEVALRSPQRHQGCLDQWLKQKERARRSNSRCLHKCECAKVSISGRTQNQPSFRRSDSSTVCRPIRPIRASLIESRHVLINSQVSWHTGQPHSEDCRCCKRVLFTFRGDEDAGRWSIDFQAARRRVPSWISINRLITKVTLPS